LTLYVSSHPLEFGSGSKFGNDWLLAVNVGHPMTIVRAMIPSFISLSPLSRSTIVNAFELAQKFVRHAPTAGMVHIHSADRIYSLAFDSLFNDGYVVGCSVALLLDRNSF
jgi:hypothetical protein